MSDLISRQAAIAHAVPLNLFGREVMMVSVSELENLPSAQADVPDTNVGDLISRQAAIDAVKKNTFRLTFAEEQNCEGHVAWSANAVYSDVMEGALLELPSAQPERKTGRWISMTSNSNNYRCSVCGRMLIGITDGKNMVTKNYPYCHCGAKMLKEGEG